MLNCSRICCVRGKNIEEILKDNNKEWEKNNTKYKNGFHKIYIFLLYYQRERNYYCCYFNNGSILFDEEFL